MRFDGSSTVRVKIYLRCCSAGLEPGIFLQVLDMSTFDRTLLHMQLFKFVWRESPTVDLRGPLQHSASTHYE